MTKGQKKFCINGHAFTVENTYHRANGTTRCRACANDWQNVAYKLIRAQIFTQYGSGCALCGFSDPRALVLDHLHGGGTKERRQLGVRAMYKRALAFPNEYQLLCANCNMIKGPSTDVA